MNKILNWTLGSFFRTLGRIIVYILIGYVLFNLFDLKSLPNIFGVLDVNADTIKVPSADEEAYVLINNNLFDSYYDLSAITQNQDATFRLSLTTLESVASNYPYLIVDICSTANLYVYRTASLGNSCTNSCISNQISITKINYQCTSNGYQGNIYRIKAPISKWGDGVDTETKNINDQISIGANIGYYAPNTIYGIYLTDDMTDNLQQIDYTSTMNTINNNISSSANDIINSQNQINSSINNSDSSQATSDASNFFTNFTTNNHGLTGIITAPLNAINSLTNAQCSPLVLPLPFVNQNLTLPCMRTIYTQYFGGFMQIYDIITLGIISYWVMVRIFGLVKDFKNPEHDEIEVVDL